MVPWVFAALLLTPDDPTRELGVTVPKLVSPFPSLRERLRVEPDYVIVPNLANPAGPLWLDQLFKAPGVRYDGNFVFTPRPSKIYGELYEHAMSADVLCAPGLAAEECGMTIPLYGKFARFQAIVGRDDDETYWGTGFCYFEAYVDGKRVFKSEAIRSKYFPVRVTSTEGKRSDPQPVDIDLRGARHLRLVVRYSQDFLQTATFSTGRYGGDTVRRAAGCLWANGLFSLNPGGSVNTEKLAQRDANVRQAGLLAGRTLRKQLQNVLRPNPKIKLAVLKIREGSRVALDDGRLREGISQALFERTGARSVGVPLAEDKEIELHDKLVRFHPRDSDDLTQAAEEARYAGATYMVVGYIENERLYLHLYDTRPEGGQLVGTATGWLALPD